MNTDITIIMPVHVLDEESRRLILEAVKTVPEEYEWRIPCSIQIVDELADLLADVNARIFPCLKTDFSSMVNRAVSETRTDWFTILEFDDQYTPVWFKEMPKYIDSDKDAKVYLPLVDLYDYPKAQEEGMKKAYRGYANEAAWAQSFSNELGYIDNDCLQTFFNFNMTGGLFHKDTFQSIGGLKPIYMSFWYEFMLRLTNKKHKIYVVPKVGYIHMVNRDGSISKEVEKNLKSSDEGEYWLEVAKQESFYKELRDVKPFVPKEENK